MSSPTLLLLPPFSSLLLLYCILYSSSLSSSFSPSFVCLHHRHSMQSKQSLVSIHAPHSRAHASARCASPPSPFPVFPHTYLAVVRGVIRVAHLLHLSSTTLDLSDAVYTCTLAQSIRKGAPRGGSSGRQASAQTKLQGTEVTGELAAATRSTRDLL